MVLYCNSIKEDTKTTHEPCVYCIIMPHHYYASLCTLLDTPLGGGGGGGGVGWEGYFSNLLSANIQLKLLWRTLVCYNLAQSIPAANVFLIDWCFHFVWLLWSTFVLSTLPVPTIRLECKGRKIRNGIKS